MDVAEEIGKWETLVSGKGPSKTRNRRQTGEDGDDTNEDEERHEDSGGCGTAGRIVEDLDDGVAGRSLGNCDRVADAE